ncbi:MAG: hypothetical protein ABSG07_16685 [Terriglobales bacterium]
MKQFAFLFLAALMLLSPIATFGQSVSLEGTWSVVITSGSTVDAIGIFTFNGVGAAEGAITNGTNANTQESVPLGTWTNNKGGKNRSFTLASYLFNNAITPPLAAITYTACTVALSSNTTFSGSCTVDNYACSLTSCPSGPVLDSGVVSISGTRFSPPAPTS